MPKVIHLDNPGGTYTATPTFVEPDKSGAIYHTSMGSNSTGAPFGIHLWKDAPGKPPQEILFYPGDHGALKVMGNTLYFIHNRAAQKDSQLEEIPGYIYPGDTVPSTVVNINDKQVAELKQQLGTAQNQANAAYAQSQKAMSLVSSLSNQVEALTARVTKLEQSGGGTSPVDKQQIEDIVWQKIMDVMWIIRQAMNSGSSTDPNIQGYLMDLTAFIKKVVGK
jgi:hypothetical protein